ncbi:membrane-bound glycerophospholipid O-acyltransferase 2-like [Glandiceps talaboti]
MMIMTMKITSVAFGLHDWSSVDCSKQHPKQRLVAIRRFPSILEYYSYIFNFQTFLIGPFCFFTDYIDFVEGKHLVPYKIKTKDGKEVIISREPSVMGALFEKIVICVLTGTNAAVFGSSYTPRGNISDKVLNSSPLYRVVYLALCMVLTIFRYVFAFTISDLVCNASGFGFNGYDEYGKPRWDLLATDLNVNIANWNISTLRWLKYACYYRVPYHKDKLTTFLSAVWHGFYPGYYWTLFLNMVMFTSTSKRVHQSVYFCGHIISILLLCILPAKKTTRAIASSNTTSTSP